MTCKMAKKVLILRRLTQISLNYGNKTNSENNSLYGAR